MALSEDKLVLLITRLLDKTRADELDWQITTTSDKYRVSFSNYSVDTESWTGPDGRIERCELQIRDQEGKIMESVSLEELRTQHIGLRSAGDTLLELHHLARRHALGVEEAVDDLLSELDDPEE